MDGNAGVVLQVCPNAETLENYTEAKGRCPAGKRGRGAGEKRSEASSYYLVPTPEAESK
jgi:hypothetical protein